MARRYYQLPSLTGLNTFDACARQGSFTAAAAELGVTLGAVSRQVKALETELDCALFQRLHRGVELTAEGIDLFQVLSSSFQQIGRLCQEFRSRSQSRDVTIAATTAFASLWLMPRLGGFWQQYRDINLNHAISDNPGDSGFVNADIRIRYGDGNWRGEQVVKLFDDRIYPVCGPGFVADHEGLQPRELLQFPLLQLDSVDPAWTGWDAWMAEWDCDSSQANFRRFNNYVVALQAAEENQGIVLGWHSQVEALIKNAKLVRIGEMEIPAPASFYLTWDETRPLSEAAQRLRDWLVAVGQEFTEPQGGVSV
ncbi:MAG: LysR family transcriptional regulator [Gammaproteobacteria bacterium]|nr:LysR family transcriptional regulator [Gammaproteobacteria bacterium]